MGMDLRGGLGSMLSMPGKLPQRAKRLLSPAGEVPMIIFGKRHGTWSMSPILPFATAVLVKTISIISVMIGMIRVSTTSVPKRFRSTRPSQALVLLNNPLVRKASKALADRVLEEKRGEIDAALERAFDLAYSRSPTAPELEAVPRQPGACSAKRDGR